MNIKMFLIALWNYVVPSELGDVSFCIEKRLLCIVWKDIERWLSVLIDVLIVIMRKANKIDEPLLCAI
jgi:hypothetical protein